MGLINADQHVFWLDVSVDDLTLGVEVLEAFQHLKRQYQVNKLKYSKQQKVSLLVAL